MELAQILSDTDGAYLYNYMLDDSFTQMTFLLTIYENGVLEREEELGGVYFNANAAQEGMLALIPDFKDFRIKLIIAGGGAKYSAEFDILEKVSGREYFGRSASGLTAKTRIVPDAWTDLAVFLYGRDGLSAMPIEDLREQPEPYPNDYMYMVSVKFSTDTEPSG